MLTFPYRLRYRLAWDHGLSRAVLGRYARTLLDVHELNFSGAPGEFGNFVASFAALGDNAIPGDVGNAIDGDLLTHTTMGNTIGTSQRLRVTLGFESSSGPVPTAVAEPGALVLLLSGLAGVAGLSRWRRVSSRSALPGP